MLILYVILCFVAAYFTGSLPLGRWIFKRNSQPTFTTQMLEWSITVLKVVGVSFLAFFAGRMYFSVDNFITFRVLLGITALLGVMFPIFKGRPKERPFALLLGIMLVLSPWISLCACGVFLIFFLIWRYLSLAFIMAAASYPLIMAFVFNERTLSLLLFAIGVVIFSLFIFESNIIKLINRKEVRFSFGKNTDETHS